MFNPLGWFTGVALGAKSEFSPLGGEANAFENYDYAERLWKEEERKAPKAIPSAPTRQGVWAPPVPMRPPMQTQRSLGMNRPLKGIRLASTAWPSAGTVFVAFLISFFVGAGMTLAA